MKIGRLVILVVGFVAALGAGKASASPTPEQVKQWLERELAIARDMSADPPIHVRWRQETRYLNEGRTLEQVRAQVTGRPEHPERGVLRAMEVEAATGKPDLQVFELWLGAPTRWRFNFTFSEGEPRDAALTGTDGWVLYRDGIELFPLSSINGRPSGHPEHEKNVFWPMVAGFRSGGLERLAWANVRVASAVVDGANFVAIIESSRGSATFEVQGRWDEGAQRGFISDVQYVKFESRAGVQGTREAYSDWHEWAPGQWMCKRVDLFKPDQDKPWRSTVLESVAAISPERLAEVTSVPQRGTRDPLRGELPTTMLIADRTTGERRWIDEKGEAHIEREDGQKPPEPASPMRWLGMTVLVAGLAAGVAWWWYRTKSGVSRRVFRS